jgi:predicted Zn-dependent protease
LRLDFGGKPAHLLEMLRSLTVALASALLAGCQLMGQATAPSVRVEPVAVVAPRIPSAAEEAIGARENPRVVAEYGGVYEDPDLEAEVARIVARLVAASDDPSRGYKITILNSPVANAFALPGGYLYVTRGLIALTDESSELAAVLSHEIAHVLLNHALERAKVAEQAQIVERVATDVLTDPTESRSARDGSRMTLATFSRNQEIEADKVGITIAGRAGFDPFAASRFLDKLQAYGEFRSAIGHHDEPAGFLASHPAALERRQLALVVARQFGAPGIGERTEDRYLKALDGMVFGDDPSEGFVRGHEFLHPRLAIAFRVPDNFRLENTKEAVLAAAGQDTAMRFDGVTVDASTVPAAYLASGWINGLVDGSIEETTVNGLPAATADAAAGAWVFRIGAVKIGGSMYRLIFADRSNSDEIEAALASTLASFQRMTATEVARLHPLRIDIVTVKQGEGIADLAARMEGTERSLELFELLNGLSPGDALTPGQSVKIVVD